MSELKERLRTDMTAALKAKDDLTLATLRMVLAAISTEEVSGDTARELSDDDVLRVLTREAKKRREASEAFAAAGRTEQAEREAAEGRVLAGYLPTQLDDAELADIARAAVDEVTAQLGEKPGQRQMGQVMKIASARVAGRAEGSRVAATVKALLQQG